MSEPARDATCIFCKIVAREVASQVLRETDRLLAFHDVNPQAPHHVLVVPKAHIATVNDLRADDAGTLGDMVLLAKELADELGVSARGYRLVLNCGREAGQTVFHIHLHLLAGRYLTWPPG